MSRRQPEAGEARPRRETPQAREGRRRLLRQLAGALALVVFWEIAGRNGNSLFVAPPSAAVRALVAAVQRGVFLEDLGTSLFEFAFGFGIALVLAAPLGILLGWYPLAFAALNPFISALNATPRIAILPIIVVLMGIDIWSKVVIVALAAGLPVLFNMIEASRSLRDLPVVNVARAFGGRDLAILRTIGLPYSLPFLQAGIRIALGRGLTALVAAEFIAARAGLGFRAQFAASVFDVPTVFGYTTVLVVLGLALFAFGQMLERPAARWRL